MSEYTPTETRLRDRVKGSLGDYAHEFGIDGEAAMDEWIDQALAERDNRVRADERAKRPDREQIDRIQSEIDNVHQIHGDTCLCGFKSSRSRSRTEHLTALFAEAVLALEPEAREVTDAECGRCGKFAEVHREGWFYDHGNPEACPGSGERPADTHVE